MDDPFDPRIVLDDSLESDGERIWLDEYNFALVSPQDIPWLSCWRWSKHFNDKGHLYCARLEGTWPTTPRRRVFMHREIMKRIGDPPSPAHRYVDHKNGDTLDNRRANLRWTTASENRINTYLHRLAHGIPDGGPALSRTQRV